jgi:hypothetical protein
MDILTKSQENRRCHIGYKRPGDQKSQGRSYLGCDVSIRTVGAMNPASRRIHRSVLGPYPKSQSRSTNQVRDRGTRARPARPPRGRGLKLGRPLDRARARSRVRVRAGFFLELWLEPAFRSGPKKLLNAWSASSCPKSMPGSV